MTDGLELDQLSGPNVHAVLARLRAAAAVSWVEVLDGWLVTSHAVALAVLRDAATFTVDHPGFSTAQVVGPSMLSTDGTEHIRHRRPFGHAFRPSAVAARFEPDTTRVARGLVTALRPLGHADLRTALAGPLSAAVVTAALGLDPVDAPTVLRWYGAIVAAVTDISAGRRPRPDAADAMSDLAASVGSVVDGTTVLGAARASLAETDVISNAAVLMFGGIETTEAMIATALLHVLTRPGVREAVRNDRSLVATAVEESLRLDPAAAVVDRYATADVMLDGVQVRRGDLVRVSLAAANRDPVVFPDPDAFDLTRTNFDAQLAFARGPHVCLAMDLARLETRVALEAVLSGLPGARIDGPAEVTGLVFRKPVSLPVRWDVSPTVRRSP